MRVVRSADRELLPANHEPVDAPGVRRRVLLQREELQSGRVQMVNWAVLPSGRSFRAHYHEDMQEVFVIVEGRALMRASDQEALLEAGDAVVIEAGEVHQMENRGEGPVQYVVFGITRDEGGRTVVVELGA